MNHSRPVLNAVSLSRAISQGIGIVFKGPGFYCTDNRRDSDKAKAVNSDSMGVGGTLPSYALFILRTLGANARGANQNRAQTALSIGRG